MTFTRRVGAFQDDPSLSQWYYDILGRLVHGGTVSEAEWRFLRKAVLALQDQDPHYFAYLQNVVVDPTIRLAIKIWLEHGQPPSGRDLQSALRVIFAASPLSRVMLRHNRALLEIYQTHGKLAANLATRHLRPLPRITFTPRNSSATINWRRIAGNWRSRSRLAATEPSRLRFWVFT